MMLMDWKPMTLKKLILQKWTLNNKYHLIETSLTPPPRPQNVLEKIKYIFIFVQFISTDVPTEIDIQSVFKSAQPVIFLLLLSMRL